MNFSGLNINFSAKTYTHLNPDCEQVKCYGKRAIDDCT